jgi:hypothetical protein
MSALPPKAEREGETEDQKIRACLLRSSMVVVGGVRSLFPDTYGVVMVPGTLELNMTQRT